MKEKDKKNAPASPEENDKIDIKKSIFQVNKDLKKQREAEMQAQQQEIERRYAEKEKQKREAYEKKLQDERIELMRLKQGLVDESEATIHEEKEEEVKLSLGKKIFNFFYHNKWWLGLGVFFVGLSVFLITDMLSKPHPDSIILMLCENGDVGNSTYLSEFFEEYADDSNGNGKVEVSVYYIPYGDDEYQNYINGVSNKLTNFLNNADSVIVIGNKKTTDELLIPDESLVDLSRLYPDDPHVKDCCYYLKNTDFAEKIGIAPSLISDDMFLALRKPKKLLHSSEKDMQKTYDKDFPLFDKMIKDLSKTK